MTRQAQEVFNQSQPPYEKYYALNVNNGQASYTEVPAPGWNRTLLPFEVLFSGNAGTGVNESGSSGNPSTQILRQDLEIVEDAWIVDFESMILVTTGIAITSMTAELSLLYVNPQGISDLNPFYDLVLSTAQPQTSFKFYFSPKQLQKLVAKGGKIQMVITLIANYAGANNTIIWQKFHNDGYCSYLKFVTSSNNTAKDFEFTAEKLPT